MLIYCIGINISSRQMDHRTEKETEPFAGGLFLPSNQNTPSQKWTPPPQTTLHGSGSIREDPRVTMLQPHWLHYWWCHNSRAWKGRLSSMGLLFLSLGMTSLLPIKPVVTTETVMMRHTVLSGHMCFLITRHPFDFSSCTVWKWNKAL